MSFDDWSRFANALFLKYNYILVKTQNLVPWSGQRVLNLKWVATLQAEFMANRLDFGALAANPIVVATDDLDLEALLLTQYTRPKANLLKCTGEDAYGHSEDENQSLWVIDGQHRLHALSNSGYNTVVVRVLRNKLFIHNGTSYTKMWMTEQNGLGDRQSSSEEDKLVAVINAAHASHLMVLKAPSFHQISVLSIHNIMDDIHERHSVPGTELRNAIIKYCAPVYHQPKDAFFFRHGAFFGALVELLTMYGGACKDINIPFLDRCWQLGNFFPLMLIEQAQDQLRLFANMGGYSIWNYQKLIPAKKNQDAHADGKIKTLSPKVNTIQELQQAWAKGNLLWPDQTNTSSATQRLMSLCTPSSKTKHLAYPGSTHGRQYMLTDKLIFDALINKNKINPDFMLVHQLSWVLAHNLYNNLPKLYNDGKRGSNFSLRKTTNNHCWLSICHTAEGFLRAAIVINQIPGVNIPFDKFAQIELSHRRLQGGSTQERLSHVYQFMWYHRDELAAACGLDQADPPFLKYPSSFYFADVDPPTGNFSKKATESAATWKANFSGLIITSPTWYALCRLLGLRTGEPLITHPGVTIPPTYIPPRPTPQTTAEPTAQTTLQPAAEPEVPPPQQPTLQPAAEPEVPPPQQTTLQPAAEPEVPPPQPQTPQTTAEPTAQTTLQPAAEPEVPPPQQPTPQPTAQPGAPPPQQPITESDAQPTPPASNPEPESAPMPTPAQSTTEPGIVSEEDIAPPPAPNPEPKSTPMPTPAQSTSEPVIEPSITLEEHTPPPSTPHPDPEPALKTPAAKSTPQPGLEQEEDIARPSTPHLEQELAPNTTPAQSTLEPGMDQEEDITLPSTPHPDSEHDVKRKRQTDEDSDHEGLNAQAEKKRKSDTPEKEAGSADIHMKKAAVPYGCIRGQPAFEEEASEEISREQLIRNVAQLLIQLDKKTILCWGESIQRTMGIALSRNGHKSGNERKEGVEEEVARLAQQVLDAVKGAEEESDDAMQGEEDQSDDAMQGEEEESDHSVQGVEEGSNDA